MAVYTVGRFQPPTIGHELLIRKVMELGGENAFVFVSSVATPKDQNPLTAAQKIDALRAMFPRGVTFVDTAVCAPKCAGPVAANDYLRSLGHSDNTLVAGSDRAPTFGPDAGMWKAGIKNGVPAPKFVGLVRTEGMGATSMSGTKARALARAGKFEEFKGAVQVGAIDDTAIEKLYNAIRARRGGTRRRKNRRRLTRNKASGRA
jgi:hypothetical protein